MVPAIRAVVVSILRKRAEQLCRQGQLLGGGLTARHVELQAKLPKLCVLPPRLLQALAIGSSRSLWRMTPRVCRHELKIVRRARASRWALEPHSSACTRVSGRDRAAVASYAALRRGGAPLCFRNTAGVGARLPWESRTTIVKW